MRYGSGAVAVKKCIKAVDSASALSSNNPPYLASVNATLLRPAHWETSRTLQPAATMIATKLCRFSFDHSGRIVRNSAGIMH